MTGNGADVVIVGGGIVGVATAYFLGEAGVPSVVIERDSVGSHASGFAYGGLNPLAGAGIPGPLFPVAREGMRLHTELARSLPEETGVATEFGPKPSLALAFAEREVDEAKTRVKWQQEQEGYTASWCDAAEARGIEPRISHEVLGAVYLEGTAEVEPYRFMLALSQAAERRGATIRHGRVTGLARRNGRVSAVALEGGEVPCQRLVLAMGPWSGEASSWLGFPLDVRPLKGQIIRLRAPGKPFECSIGWASNYATTKGDGLLWAGTTEEEAGFDENPTADARDKITASLLKMVPSLAEARLEQHTACLRPITSDGLLSLGAAPEWEGVYVATGAGRKGILLGTAMGRIAADLVTRGSSDIPIEAFDPARSQAGPAKA